MEMNTVYAEHPTPNGNGVDIVKEQIKTAAGQELPLTSDIHITGRDDA